MLGGVLRLTSSVVVKEALTEYLEREAESLQFILRNTTIPVPIVYDLQPAPEAGLSHLFIQFMEGEMLARKWRVLTSAQRRVVMRKLGEFVEQLRNLQQSSPSGWIGSVSGKGSYDARISTSRLFGPFKNEQANNDWRISTFHLFGQQHEPTACRLREIRHQMPDNHRVYFTHGDISIHNVLVKVHGEGENDIEVTALLDWEQAGWRPEFWEAAKIVYGMDRNHEWSRLALEMVVPGYEEELRIEDELLYISGPPR